MSTELGPDIHAHHGAPPLYARDLAMLQACRLWIQTVRSSGGYYGPDWLPSDVDFSKSRLFWRLRSGKPPLPQPPPTAYSCPWYEVIEEIRPHWCFGDFHLLVEGPGTLDDPKIAIAQSVYDLVERTAQGYLVRFGPWTFDVWKGTQEVPSLNAKTGQPETRRLDGCWIQRRLEAGETVGG